MLATLQPTKKGSPPWVNSGLRDPYNQRNAVRRRYRRTRDDRLWSEFQSLAAQAEQRTNEAREAVIGNRISEALDNNKNIWRELRNLGLSPEAKREQKGSYMVSRPMNSTFTLHRSLSLRQSTTRTTMIFWRRPLKMVSLLVK